MFLQEHVVQICMYIMPRKSPAYEYLPRGARDARRHSRQGAGGIDNSTLRLKPVLFDEISHKM